MSLALVALWCVALSAITIAVQAQGEFNNSKSGAHRPLPKQTLTLFCLSVLHVSPRPDESSSTGEAPFIRDDPKILGKILGAVLGLLLAGAGAVACVRTGAWDKFRDRCDPARHYDAQVELDPVVGAGVGAGAGAADRDPQDTLSTR